LENSTGRYVRGYEIINASGQLLSKSLDLTSEKNIEIKDFNLEPSLNSGLYYIRLYIDDKIITRKFIVIK
jgi:uncharacterized protein YfaS (alpha-2-macroglobulin family)